MKQTIKALLSFALVATFSAALVSCGGGSNETQTQPAVEEAPAPEAAAPAEEASWFDRILNRDEPPVVIIVESTEEPGFWKKLFSKEETVPEPVVVEPEPGFFASTWSRLTGGSDTSPTE